MVLEEEGADVSVILPANMHSISSPARALTTDAERRSYAVSQARIREHERGELINAREAERMARQAVNLRSSPGRHSPGRGSSNSSPLRREPAASSAKTNERAAPSAVEPAADPVAQAEARGLQRGGAYLEWLHSEVERRPIAPVRGR